MSTVSLAKRVAELWRWYCKRREKSEKRKKKRKVEDNEKRKERSVQFQGTQS